MMICVDRNYYSMKGEDGDDEMQHDCGSDKKKRDCVRVKNVWVGEGRYVGGGV